MRADVILADSAVAAEGKLYLQGAAWNTLWAPEFPFRLPRLGVAIVIHVPYTATNEGHRWEVRIDHEDGDPLPVADAPPGQEPDTPEGKITKFGSPFTVGRPPFLPAGAEQLLSVAVNIDGIMFEKPGNYSLIVALDGHDLDESRYTFGIYPIPPGAMVVQQAR